MLKISEAGKTYVGSPAFLEAAWKQVLPLVEAGVAEEFCTAYLMMLAINGLVRGPSGTPLTLAELRTAWLQNTEAVAAAFKRCHENAAMLYRKPASATIQ